LFLKAEVEERADTGVCPYIGCRKRPVDRRRPDVLK